jgi:hypothetical protein
MSMSPRPLLSLVFVCVALVGCIRSLPPPKTRYSSVSPTQSYERVCGHGDKRITLRSQAEPPVSVIVECSPERAVIVCLNSFNVRVRTITISRAGETRDEVSFLASNTESAERLFAEIGAVLTNSAQENVPFSVQVRERQSDSARPR